MTSNQEAILATSGDAAAPAPVNGLPSPTTPPPSAPRTSPSRPRLTTSERNKQRQGTREDNGVWSYFTCDPEYSTCSLCSVRLKGRSVSAAIRHLSIHESAYEAFVHSEVKRLPNKLNRMRLEKLISKRSPAFTPATKGTTTPVSLPRTGTKRSVDGSYVTIQVVPAPATPPQKQAPQPPAKRATGSGSASQSNQEAKESVEHRSQRFRHILVEMVTTTSVPAHLVDNEVFRKMVSFLDPRMPIPSRETLVREVARTHRQVLQDMRLMLSQAERISVGIDVCERKTVTQGMLAVTAHFFRDATRSPATLTLSSHCETNRVIPSTWVVQTREHQRRKKNKIPDVTACTQDHLLSLALSRTHACIRCVHAHTKGRGVKLHQSLEET